MGAANVIDAAVDHNVERVVVLSTDKAVYPINAMGITKALMERTMIATAREHRNQTVLCGTRYGNVMYTRGSVIPYLIELMKAGKPLKVTNPRMTRFVMSLDESVDLVLYAMAQGKGGELYVRKAPGATIGDLAEAVASVFSYKGGVEEIGIRPGEKMHETLISSEEMARSEDCGEYFRIHPEVPSMDSKAYYYAGRRDETSPPKPFASSDKLLSVEELKTCLLAIPEIQEELAGWKPQK
jgi:UDP-glucose 4-epimerase